MPLGWGGGGGGGGGAPYNARAVNPPRLSKY